MGKAGAAAAAAMSVLQQRHRRDGSHKALRNQISLDTIEHRGILILEPGCKAFGVIRFSGMRGSNGCVQSCEGEGGRKVVTVFPQTARKPRLFCSGTSSEMNKCARPGGARL